MQKTEVLQCLRVNLAVFEGKFQDNMGISFHLYSVITRVNR